MNTYLKKATEQLENACHALHRAAYDGDLDWDLYRRMQEQIYHLEQAILGVEA